MIRRDVAHQPRPRPCSPTRATRRAVWRPRSGLEAGASASPRGERPRTRI